jgi:hypothetical protein
MMNITPKHLTREMNNFECTNLERGTTIVRAGQNMNLSEKNA